MKWELIKQLDPATQAFVTEVLNSLERIEKMLTSEIVTEEELFGPLSGINDLEEARKIAEANTEPI